MNYNTAAGYKAAALGLRQAAKLAADRPLLPLMGEKPLTDEEEERVRAKVMEVVATSSLRLLKEAARAERPKLGGSTKEAAEANGNQVGRPPKKVDPVEDAVKTWTLAMAGIRKIPDFSWKFLPLSEAEGVMVELDGVREKLKARIAELKAAKSGGRSRKEASR